MIKDTDMKEKYSQGRQRSETFSYKKIINKWDEIIGK